MSKSLQLELELHSVITTGRPAAARLVAAIAPVKAGDVAHGGVATPGASRIRTTAIAVAGNKVNRGGRVETKRDEIGRPPGAACRRRPADRKGRLINLLERVGGHLVQLKVSGLLVGLRIGVRFGPGVQNPPLGWPAALQWRPPVMREQAAQGGCVLLTAQQHRPRVLKMTRCGIVGEGV